MLIDSSLTVVFITVSNIMSSSSENFFVDTKRLRGVVKHSILHYYLGAYFGILGQTPWFSQVVYVDGFSGPGKYVTKDGNEEDGSPIIAINTVIDHMHYKNFNKPIIMYFIEAEKEYADKLKANIDGIINSRNVDQEKVIVNILHGDFEQMMANILAETAHGPMLVFADPFGIKHVPMDLMRKIANRPLTELFINVMFSSNIRWVDCPQNKKVLNELLGEENSEWKRSVFKPKENRSESFIKYYVEKLTDLILITDESITTFLQ